MKKLLSLVLALLILLPLSACGISIVRTDGTTSPEEETATPETAEQPADSETEPARQLPSVPTGGLNKENCYYGNLYFDIGIDLNSSWTFFDRDERSAMSGGNVDLTDQKDILRALDEGISVIDMMAVYSDRTVSVTVEKNGIEADSPETERKCLEASFEKTRKELASAGFKLDGEITEIDFAGGRHPSVRFVTRVAGAEVFYLGVVVKQGVYDAFIIISSASSGKIDGLASRFFNNIYGYVSKDDPDKPGTGSIMGTVIGNRYVSQSFPGLIIGLDDTWNIVPDKDGLHRDRYRSELESAIRSGGAVFDLFAERPSSGSSLYVQIMCASPEEAADLREYESFPEPVADAVCITLENLGFEIEKLETVPQEIGGRTVPGISMRCFHKESATRLFYSGGIFITGRMIAVVMSVGTDEVFTRGMLGEFAPLPEEKIPLGSEVKGVNCSFPLYGLSFDTGSDWSRGYDWSAAECPGQALPAMLRLGLIQPDLISEYVGSAGTSAFQMEFLHLYVGPGGLPSDKDMPAFLEPVLVTAGMDRTGSLPRTATKTRIMIGETEKDGYVLDYGGQNIWSKTCVVLLEKNGYVLAILMNSKTGGDFSLFGKSLSLKGG
ncbi:MAG: hypothetical protein ILP01_04595 [Clostridia bacterium]|nr:hypothetical protein [Clostridia bacterium]